MFQSVTKTCAIGYVISPRSRTYLFFFAELRLKDGHKSSSREKIRPSGSHFGSQNEDLSKDSRIEDVMLSRLGGIVFLQVLEASANVFF